MASPFIHPSASIGDHVVIEEDVRVGPYCAIDGAGTLERGVEICAGASIDGTFIIGTGTLIESHTVIRGTTKIGRNNRIGPHASIGTPAQHVRYPESVGSVVIGNNNTLREYVCVHAPTVEAATVIADGCYLMAYVNIDHDCRIGSQTVLSTHTTLSGHVDIGDFVNCGLDVIIHQHCRVGTSAMVGMGSVVRRDVLPFCTVAQGQIIRVNRIGLTRRGVSEDEIVGIENALRCLPAERASPAWYVDIIKNFCALSERGYYGAWSERS